MHRSISHASRSTQLKRAPWPAVLVASVMAAASCTATDDGARTGTAAQALACDDPDGDGDGRDAEACGGDDCDDDDGNRFPGNAEVCDPAHHDEDCDPTTFGVRDQDADGFPDDACCNGAECGTDCDDALADVHPTEAESCDSVDNDCDGIVDEYVSARVCADLDGDGYGAGARVNQCADAPGFSPLCNDCNDADARFYPGVQVCTGAASVSFCAPAGAAVSAGCAIPGQTSDIFCVRQPSGAGVCVPRKPGHG